MSVLGVLAAILTIVGPALTPLLVLWMERYQARKDASRHEEIDEHILQHLKGNKAGLIALSTQLERLQREARRKSSRHS